MGYRAEVIGGILNVQQGPTGGTQVTCDFDVKSKRTQRGEEQCRKRHRAALTRKANERS